MAIKKLFQEPLRRMEPKKALIKALKENKEVLVQANREQMTDGEDAFGNAFPDYSAVSISMGKTPGPWTLRDTGAFKGAMFAKVDNEGTTISSTDPKTAMLEEKTGSGKDIFGLQQKNLAEVVNTVIWYPFTEEVKDRLKKK